MDGQSRRRTDVEGDGLRRGGQTAVFTLRANTEQCSRFTSLIGRDGPELDSTGDVVPLAVYPGSRCLY